MTPSPARVGARSGTVVLDALVLGTLVVVGLLTASDARAQAGRVDVEVAPMEITVGDRARATITAAWLGADLAGEVRFPTWQETWGDAEVLAVSEIEASVDAAGRHVWRQTLELTAWEPGLVELPSIRVQVPLGERTESLASEAPAAAFTVGSILPEAPEDAAGGSTVGVPGTDPNGPGAEERGADPQLEPRPSAPPERLRRVQNRFYLATGALVVALGLAVFALLHALARLPAALGADGAEIDPVAGLPPLDELMARIERLDPALATRAHTGLSLALRRFLSRRLDTPAVESTTTEIQRHLRTKAVPAEIGQRTVALLRECDLVKFAGETADAETTAARFDRARELARRLEERFAPRPDAWTEGASETSREVAA